MILIFLLGIVPIWGFADHFREFTKIHAKEQVLDWYGRYDPRKGYWNLSEISFSYSPEIEKVSEVHRYSSQASIFSFQYKVVFIQNIPETCSCSEQADTDRRAAP